ncbi:MAG: helix-turn-helix domain-containing protein [Candidatus Pacearchaeota archaeon]
MSYKVAYKLFVYKPEFKIISWKLYQKGFKTYEIANALGTSTRTVWKWILKHRNNRKISRKGWRRRWGNNRRLTSVKIKRIQYIQRVFFNLMDWLQNAEILDFDAIVEGKPV